MTVDRYLPPTKFSDHTVILGFGSALGDLMLPTRYVCYLVDGWVDGVDGVDGCVSLPHSCLYTSPVPSTRYFEVEV